MFYTIYFYNKEEFRENKNINVLELNFEFFKIDVETYQKMADTKFVKKKSKVIQNNQRPQRKQLVILSTYKFSNK